MSVYLHGYLCTMCVQCLQKPEVQGSPGPKVTAHCEWPCQFQEWNLSSSSGEPSALKE